jgi:hypothetical protein
MRSRCRYHMDNSPKELDGKCVVLFISLSPSSSRKTALGVVYKRFLRLFRLESIGGSLVMHQWICRGGGGLFNKSREKENLTKLLKETGNLAGSDLVWFDWWKSAAAETSVNVKSRIEGKD